MLADRIARRDEDRLRVRDRLEHARRRVRALAPVEPHAAHGVLRMALHQVLLERQIARIRLDHRPHRVVGHRQQPHPHAERARDLRHDRRSVAPSRSSRVRCRCVARSRSPIWNHVSCPKRRSDSSQRNVSPRSPQPRSSSTSPASAYVTMSGSGETYSPWNHVVVAGVDDRRDALVRHDRRQRAQKARSADAAAEHRDHRTAPGRHRRRASSKRRLASRAPRPLAQQLAAQLLQLDLLPLGARSTAAAAGTRRSGDHARTSGTPPAARTGRR